MTRDTYPRITSIECHHCGLPIVARNQTALELFQDAHKRNIDLYCNTSCYLRHELIVAVKGQSVAELAY